jgi:hypothetical protein
VPAGAHARVQRDGQTAVTPALVRLERKSPQLITLERDGFEPATVRLTSTRSGYIWRNFVWLHPVVVVVGIVVDHRLREVRKGGLEPPRVLPHRILNPARLPIPPLSRDVTSDRPLL